MAVVFILLLKKRGRSPSLRFSSSQLINALNPTLRIRMRALLKYLRAFSLVFVMFALARPQSPTKGALLELKGVDIVLAIDCSTSMLAEDFNVKNQRANRLDVTKQVVADFIAQREGDRIGVVSFGSHAYTSCPLTVDYDWAKRTVAELQIGIAEDSTSIGYAIANSLNRLRASDAKSKIVVLLTDGRSNTGDIAPQTAAEMAKALGVKIYTIGVGTKGEVPFPFKDSLGDIRYKSIKVDLDEESLEQIAHKTGGRYFRAADVEALKNVYKEISELEKSDIKGKRFSEYDEVFGKFLLIALTLLLIEIVLDNTILRKLP
ncbi:MAG: VWA domain-containing protein [Candidatus Omnitrophota bacterium]